MSDLTTIQRNLLYSRVFARLGLAERDCAPLLAFARVGHYADRQSLVASGESWRSLYLIESGIVRMFYSDLKGRDFNKAFFAESQCIWPVAPVDRANPVKFNISAIGPCVTLELPIARVEAFLRSQACWEAFALPFAEKLVETKFRREHDFLLLSAAERLDNFCAEQPDIAARIPEYHLASMLGITNVTLSRIRSRRLKGDT